MNFPIHQTKFDKIINTLTAVFTAILAVVAIWYSIETRNLRIASEDEIDVLKMQMDLSIFPDLYPSAISNVTDLVMEGKIYQSSGNVKYSKEDFAKIVKYYVAIENIGDRAAYDAFVYIYSADTKSFMKASTYKVYVRPDKVTSVSFFDQKEHYVDNEQISEYIADNYYVEIDNLNNFIKSPDLNCMFLIYKDIQNNVFLRTRQFTFDKDENAVHKSTQFYQLD